MEECRMPKLLMYGELEAGKRNQGRSKLQYKDTVKANLQWCYINPGDLKGYTMERPKWQGSVHRCQKLTAARERHCRAALAVITTTDFQCPHSSRFCASGLGLQSGIRIHRWVVEHKHHHWIRWTTINCVQKIIKKHLHKNINIQWTRFPNL